MKTANNINWNQLTNPAIRTALEAQQKHDLTAWFAVFSDNPTFINDDKTEDFKQFFENAFNFHEKLLSIEKVDETGTHITGNYFGGKYGTYRISIRFRENSAGKLDYLEIKQIGLMLNEAWHQPAF